jgi:hypothetical protein
MTRMPLELSPLPVLLLVVGFLGAGDALAAPLQSWVATARIRSGSTTLTDTPSPGSPGGPVDSTGFLEANGIDVSMSPPIDAGAIAEFDLPNGTLGVSTGFDATANGPDDLRVFDPYAGASTLYLDDVSVTSSTLPSGTPVTVRFVFDLSFTADATSTLPEATASADITSTAAGFQGIAPADHRYLSILESSTFVENGLFLPPHQAEYTIQTTVGSTFPFALSMDASSFGTVRALGPPGSIVNHESSGWMGLGISFGGEVVGADAQLVSGLLGGPFPAADAVGAGASAAALPENPFVVPEPTVFPALSIGVLVLFAARARSSGSPGRSDRAFAR